MLRLKPKHVGEIYAIRAAEDIIVEKGQFIVFSNTGAISVMSEEQVRLNFQIGGKVTEFKPDIKDEAAPSRKAPRSFKKHLIVTPLGHISAKIVIAIWALSKCRDVRGVVGDVVKQTPQGFTSEWVSYGFEKGIEKGFVTRSHNKPYVYGLTESGKSLVSQSLYVAAKENMGI